MLFAALHDIVACVGVRLRRGGVPSGGMFAIGASQSTAGEKGRTSYEDAGEPGPQRAVGIRLLLKRRQKRVLHQVVCCGRVAHEP